MPEDLIIPLTGADKLFALSCFSEPGKTSVNFVYDRLRVGYVNNRFDSERIFICGEVNLSDQWSSLHISHEKLSDLILALQTLQHQINQDHAHR